jgi:hypothetical protein
MSNIIAFTGRGQTVETLPGVSGYFASGDAGQLDYVGEQNIRKQSSFPS